MDKEEKQEFQKKKVNRLNLDEAKNMLSLLEKRGQQDSKKYSHVLVRLEKLQNIN